MRSGVPYYATYGLVECKQALRVRVNDEFVDLKTLENFESIWSQTEIDLSGRDSVTGIELNIFADVKKNLNNYDWMKFIDHFDFIVCVTNTSSRKRTNFKGVTKAVKAGNSRTPIRYEGHLENRVIDLADFSGEIKLEPLFVVKDGVLTGKLLDTKSGMSLVPGTVIAYCEPIRIILNREKRGLMSLFEFVWRSFTKDKELGLPDSGVFAVNWSSTPQLFINTDIESLETILTSEAKVGRQAVARDSINLTVAHQVVTSVLGLIIKKIKKEQLESPDASAEEIGATLESQEKQFLSSWSYVLDPEHSPNLDLNRSIENLMALEEIELNNFMIKEIPEILQSELGSHSSVEKLLKLTAIRIEDTDGE
jgi:hypothetical protein